MELWPKDAWSVCSRPAGAVYAGCILLSLATYVYTNRVAPVAGSVLLLILAIVFIAFALLAGTSNQTWADPSNALALLLIACAFLLDGFFVAGASIFGPTKVMDVGVALELKRDPRIIFLWNEGHWIHAKLPKRISYDDLEKIRSWSQNLKLTNDLETGPGRVQMSMWDRQVQWITMKNSAPPTTIGEPPRTNVRAFVELTLSLVFLLLSFAVWREGRRRGIRFRANAPFIPLAKQYRAVLTRP